jgi:hypothetical protein
MCASLQDQMLIAVDFAHVLEIAVALCVDWICYAIG